MSLMTTPDVGKKGEECVVVWFRSRDDFKNAKINWDTHGKGATDIRVDTSSKILLVQVKTSVEPNQPGDLTSDEKSRIKQRATSLNAEAWAAKVQLNANLHCKNIDWIRL